MILDLIVIILIVILSFLLCINNSNKNSCHLSHVIIGLTVLIFYKLVTYYNYKQEQFTVSESINDFISGNTVNTITTAEAKSLSDNKLTEYTNTIKELTQSIKELNNNNLQKQNNVGTNVGSSNIDSISLENKQAYQQFQIDFLAKQIKNSQDIINYETVNKTSQNYKPIKVFSSCVSNADGSLTFEQPIINNIQGSVPLNNVVNSSEGQQILNTIEQTSNNNPNLFALLSKNFNVS